jgi:hypothetical protein
MQTKTLGCAEMKRRGALQGHDETKESGPGAPGRMLELVSLQKAGILPSPGGRGGGGGAITYCRHSISSPSPQPSPVKGEVVREFGIFTCLVHDS